MMSRAQVEQLEEAEQLLATVIAILEHNQDHLATTHSPQTLKKRLTTLHHLRKELRRDVAQAHQAGQRA